VQCRELHCGEWLDGVRAVPREHVFWSGGAELQCMPEFHAVGRGEQREYCLPVCRGLYRSGRARTLHVLHRRHVQERRGLGGV